jgi:hypothetical protein
MQGRVEILAQTLPWDWQKASPPVWHSSPRQGPVEEELWLELEDWEERERLEEEEEREEEELLAEEREEEAEDWEDWEDWEL